MLQILFNICLWFLRQTSISKSIHKIPILTFARPFLKGIPASALSLQIIFLCWLLSNFRPRLDCQMVFPFPPPLICVLGLIASGQKWTIFDRFSENSCRLHKVECIAPSASFLWLALWEHLAQVQSQSVGRSEIRSRVRKFLFTFQTITFKHFRRTRKIRCQRAGGEMESQRSAPWSR